MPGWRLGESPGKIDSPSRTNHHELVGDLVEYEATAEYRDGHLGGRKHRDILCAVASGLGGGAGTDHPVRRRPIRRIVDPRRGPRSPRVP